MKRVIIVAVGLVVFIFLLPLILIEVGRDEAVLPALPTPAHTQTKEDQGTIVRVKTGEGQVVEMSMSDYLWSVTAAEMPASFELEALKAQAVTARTYTAWKMKAGEEIHPDADVCTEFACCQAFISPENVRAGWGEEANRYTEKIRKAVEETDGEIMTYQGEIVQAVFFSSAAGRTEDAVAVWGNAVPYLVGVDSPEGENVPNYRTQVTLTQGQFREIFLERFPKADLSGSPESWFRNISTTASGRVAQMEVGGVVVKGTELRSLFDLRSTSFAVEFDEEHVRFQVTGYGHGVGMSQYGANTMAQQGKTYQEILTWYYTGVEVGVK